MGRLTTHVLDTAHGCPGGGIDIELFRLEGTERKALGSARTDDDGRCAAPLLEGDDFTDGEYELEFAVGRYFDGMAREGAIDGSDESTGPAREPSRFRFLDRVVIRFGVAEPDEHYHVPLLISPYAYSTYRGS